MSSPASADILIRIDTIDQLFNDPAINPFSDKTPVILGEAALPLVIRQSLSGGLLGRHGKRLIIQLPPDQISPDLQSQVVNAVLRYAKVKRADNDASIRISRWHSLRGLIMAILIATVLLTILVILNNTILAGASDAVIGIVAGLVTIFIWSTVWNPWDRLVYEWMEPWLENRILHKITLMEILVQPEPISADL
jgi:hypothetical protein